MKTLTVIAALAATTLLAGCGVNPNDAKRALEAQGITGIQLGGYSVFGCAKGDHFSSKFTGVGVNGKPVSGVVCSGLLKGTTIRYD
ncbi:hypothetical protein B9J07_28060 [Sinorhizobium sp. LM21]|uniref:hypothetical protein n=1 Tax=Sinorhizobium sp. LM21 TaxID=1449788 RepID=UPI0005D92F79|nr:hypothetical protein [Sinorhizobium sp. LM21]AJW30153.1 hypothetical protein pLM21S1_p32 [Sinorhizobium sp. LM21]OWZ90443.1 hypothetical protein B9J07_28060 [Sinorhizobium sp. LM21]